jgi:hypothetical protein
MTIIRVALIALSVMLCAAIAPALTLTEDGDPVAMIIVPRQPTATEQFAADELQSYLEQISGTTLVIGPESDFVERPRLLVGNTATGRSVAPIDGGEPETFVVRTDGDDLVLRGASDRATLYAVYDFLEQDLGCRWLGPGEAWEHTPRQADIEVGPIDRTEQPDMKYRFLRMTFPADAPSHHHDVLSWAVKQKINIGAGWPQTELPDSFVRRGGFRAWMSPHVLHHALSPEDYFAQHPEYFALRGDRRPKAERGGFQQVCTTNPEVIDCVAHALDEMFGARSEVDFMGLGQGDGVAFCQCDECLALDTGELWPHSSRELPVITERWMRFCNEVARKLQQTRPGKKIYTLAYHQTFRPPDPDTFEIEPNVMVQVVNSRPNYVCFVHRFENEDCPHHNRFRAGIEQWVEMTPGGVMVYEYTPHSTFCAMPYPAPWKFADDIAYLDEIGLVGYEGQSSPRIWGTYGINYYTIAKATWDAGIDADALVADYCDHAFGPASVPMQRFLRTVEQALVDADHITEGVWTWMTPEAMAQCREHLDAAHAAAANAGRKVRDRLRDWEIDFYYGELGAQAWRKAERGMAEDDPGLLREAIDLADRAAAYLDETRREKTHLVGNDGKLTRVYQKQWQRALERMEQ